MRGLSTSLGRAGVIGALLLLGLGPALGEDDPFPRVEASPLAAGETGVVHREIFVDPEGRSKSLTWSRDADGAIHARWFEPLPDGSTRSETVTFPVDDPSRLLDAASVRVTADGTVAGRVRGGDVPRRDWSHGTARGTRTGEEDLPALPSVELQLALTLRTIAWRYGGNETLPLLWNLDAIDDGGPEPLRRATVLCAGRETLRRPAGALQCWRVVVESQGRHAPIRAVFWIGVEAPHDLVRWETDEGVVLERAHAESGPAPEASPPTGETAPSSDGDRAARSGEEPAPSGGGTSDPPEGSGGSKGDRAAVPRARSAATASSPSASGADAPIRLTMRPRAS